MLELKITITADEKLTEALSGLRSALSGIGGIGPATTADRPVAPVSAAPVSVAAPTTPVIAPIPTAAPTYTIDQIAEAGAALVDGGKMDQLIELLGRYKVDSLVALDPSTFGAVAAELRAMGAQI